MSAVQSLNINSSSYAGELALPYIAPAILSANTIADNLIEIHNNVKYKAVLKKLSNAAEIIDAATCDFDTTAGDLDLDEVVLTITELQVNQQLCKKDFRQDWEALQTGASLLGDRLPPNFETFLLQFLAAKVQEGIEKSIWQGNFNNANGTGTANTLPFDGLFHRAVDSTLGNEDSAAGANTAGNILGRVDAMVTDAPSAVLNASDSVIYMSRKAQYLFQRALGGIITTSGAAPTDGNILTGVTPSQYMGIPIVTPMGMPDDAMMFTPKSNLHFGCNLYTDQIEAKVVDMSLTDASDNVRVAMRFSGGVQIGTPGDVSIFRRSS